MAIYFFYVVTDTRADFALIELLCYIYYIIQCTFNKGSAAKHDNDHNKN